MIDELMLQTAHQRIVLELPWVVSLRILSDHGQSFFGHTQLFSFYRKLRLSWLIRQPSDPARAGCHLSFRLMPCVQIGPLLLGLEPNRRLDTKTISSQYSRHTMRPKHTYASNKLVLTRLRSRFATREQCQVAREATSLRLSRRVAA